MVPGAAGDLTLIGQRGRTHGMATVSGRWYGAHALPPQRDSPELPLGGLTTFFHVGVGYSF